MFGIRYLDHGLRCKGVGQWLVLQRQWSTDQGSGKVAGKVLIVDYGVGYAKLLILLDSVM